MNLSKFGEKFTRKAGITQLMDDLGAAMAQGDMLMLGGGNPAHIPEMQNRFRQRMMDLLEEEAGFESMIGNYDGSRGNAEFIERARSDWVKSLDIDQNSMRDDDGLIFAVRRVEADYMAPAHYDNELQVQTIIHAVTGARLVMDQTVLRGEETLFSAQVTIVCINNAGQPSRLPANIRLMLH